MKLVKYARSILSAMVFLFFGIAALPAFAGEWNAAHLGVVVATPDARWKVEVNQISPTVGRLSLGDAEKKASTRLIISAVPNEVALPVETFVKVQYDELKRTYFKSYPYEQLSETVTKVTLNGGAQATYVQHEYKYTDWRGGQRSHGKLYGEAFVDGKKVYFVMFVTNHALHEPLGFNHPDVVRLIKDMRVLDETK